MRLSMRSQAVRRIFVTALVVGLAFEGAFAQVVAQPPARVAPAVAPTPAPVLPTPIVPTVTPRRVRTGGGGNARNNEAGVTVGGGGVSGGGGPGLGVGLGVAGAALAIGFIGAMGRPSAFSGQNSSPLETGPLPVDQNEEPPRYTRQIRPRTQDQNPANQPRQHTPNVIRPGFNVPSAKETRYVPDEVLLVVKGEITPQRLKRLETTYGLTPLASARIGLLKADVRRYRLKPGASVRTTIAALRGSPAVTSAQPNYRFELQGDTTSPPSKAMLTPADGKIAPSPIPTTGPVQYAIDILRLTQAHKIATGADVRVAIIDSGVDETNSDLMGAVVERFDALGGTFKAQSHGTAMAGAIVAHHTLVGVAPKAKLIAIRAFAGASVGANGTGFDILRGLDFAASHGARIVNMSFAGPQDMLLETALQAARKQGIIAIAAAGNGGPLAKPAYPGAEAGVIAVTATDAAGRTFPRANRGTYIAVAAPGVDIIAPGLGESVQITSGTSIATAEVSGVAALVLERDPEATPDRVLKVLRSTARRLTVEPAAGGAGIIDADAAVAAAK